MAVADIFLVLIGAGLLAGQWKMVGELACIKNELKHIIKRVDDLEQDREAPSAPTISPQA